MSLRRLGVAGVLVILAGCSASPKAVVPSTSGPPPTSSRVVHLATMPLGGVPIPAGRVVVDVDGHGTEVVPFRVASVHLFTEENCLGPGPLSLTPFLAVERCNNMPVYGTVTIYPDQRHLDLRIEASPGTRWSVYIVDERT